MRLTATGEQRISLEATTGSNPAAVTAPVPGLETVRVAAPELEIDPVVAREPAIVLAAGQEPATDLAEVRELATVPVAALELATDLAEVPVLEIAPVVERELVIVPEVAPVRNLRHARLAVPAKTKLVTAVRHRGQAPLLAVAEDLEPVVVETTREPAAIEAVTAWEEAE